MSTSTSDRMILRKSRPKTVSVKNCEHWTFFIFRKLPKVNNRPNVENSANLVTLTSTDPS
jgi:hypothetical protein